MFTLLLLRKFSVECRWKLSVIEYARDEHITLSAFAQTQSRIHIKSIISVIDNRSPYDFARKIAPECGESPFAADNVG
jgi:hypothetical protein